MSSWLYRLNRGPMLSITNSVIIIIIIIKLIVNISTIRGANGWLSPIF